MRYIIEVKHSERCISCYSCVFACSRHLFNSVDPSRTAVFIELDRTASKAPIVTLCRFCKDPECAIACPHDALRALPEGGITLNSPKCAVCTTYDCVKACQFNALILDKNNKIPILCDKCGDCAKYCPHSVFWYTEESG